MKYPSHENIIMKCSFVLLDYQYASFVLEICNVNFYFHGIFIYYKNNFHGIFSYRSFIVNQPMNNHDGWVLLLSFHWVGINENLTFHGLT